MASQNDTPTISGGSCGVSFIMSGETEAKGDSVTRQRAPRPNRREDDGGPSVQRPELCHTAYVECEQEGIPSGRVAYSSHEVPSLEAGCPESAP